MPNTMAAAAAAAAADAAAADADLTLYSQVVEYDSEACEPEQICDGQLQSATRCCRVGAAGNLGRGPVVLTVFEIIWFSNDTEMNGVCGFAKEEMSRV